MTDESYHRPSNCHNLTVPVLNPGMWSRVKPDVRSDDVKYQRMIRILLQAFVPVLRILDVSRSNVNDEWSTRRGDITRYAGDAMGLLAHLNWELNQHRKDNIKTCLDGPYKQICSETRPFTNNLFGDNLPAELKDIGTTSRTMNESIFTPENRAGDSKNVQGRFHYRRQKWEFQRQQRRTQNYGRGRGKKPQRGFKRPNYDPRK